MFVGKFLFGFKDWVVNLGSLTYQPTTISKQLCGCYVFFAFLRVCTHKINSIKHDQLKIYRLHFTTLKGRELVSSLHKRSKNEFEIFVILCINV